MTKLLIRELINKIEYDYPINSSMSYDNSGANIICFDNEISGILVCLDVTFDAVNYAKENNINLIISHHPIIFNEIRNINDDPVSKRIKLLNKFDISAYSCHTNYDVNIDNGMGGNLIKLLFSNKEIVSHEFLDSFDIENKQYAIGDIITLKDKIEFNDIVSLIKNKLELEDNKISYYNFNNFVKKIVIIPGSGSGDIDLVIKSKPDLLITSDLKHNNIIDLREENISFINATHYGLEKIFIESFYNYLINKFNCFKILKFYINL